MRGAGNTLTFGGADHLEAGAAAAFQPGDLGTFRERYEANLAEEAARDRYDAVHRPWAQKLGALGGTALGLAAMGPTKVLVRLPGAAPLSAREGAALLGAGAGGGIGAQAASDIASGGRRSSVGDYTGAAVGGAVGAVSLPLGAARVGAADGWTTSIVQDALNGRPISLGGAGQAALGAGLLGGLTDRFGVKAINGLSPSAKGKVGEFLGDMRSTINGQRREWGPKTRAPLKKGYWYPDGRSGSTMFEDKFGHKAALSTNQKRAQAELGSNFKLYHFLPEDIGRWFSRPAAAVGGQATLDRSRRN